MIKYKFVTWEGNDSGDEYTTNEFCKKLYEEDRIQFCYHDLISQGIIKRGGYAYSFKDYLKKYVYKTSYGIYEGYAPNKTLLRKNLHTKCDYIMEIV